MQTVLRNCLLFLSVFFISSSTHQAFGQAVEFKNESALKAAIYSPVKFFVSSDRYYNEPVQSESTPEEPENSVEADQESIDDDCRLFYWIHSSDYAFRIATAVRNQLYQSVQSYQNQASLPLYVMFHSWKNYLL
ncbi:MAG: hypothetical protein ACXWW0_00695 [Bacteroidia bacterium]